MKIAILIIIIFSVLVLFRFLKNLNVNKKFNKTEEKIIDLEKDPKSDEYKPKE